MNRIAGFLSRSAGIIGVLLALSGLFVYAVAPHRSALVTGIEVAALACLVFFFVKYFELVKAFSARRSTRLGANSLLMVVLVVAVLSILNFIFSRHNIRMDLSETSKFTLSDQTVKVLKNLQHEVKATGFFQDGTRPRTDFKDMVDNYRHHTDRLKYELIDPDRNPAIAKQYGVTQYNTVVLESEGKEARIKGAMEAISEEELTNALVRVSREGRKVVYFLEGHNERPTADTGPRGLSQAKEALEREGYEVKTLSLFAEGKVPDDASILVMGGPERALIQGEIQAIRQFRERGGQIFLMLDPQATTGLEELLAEWGVRMPDEIILDTSPNLMLLGLDETNVLVVKYTSHEIVRDLRLGSLFPLSRSVEALPAAPEGVRYEALAQSGPESWGERDLTSREARFDPSVDGQGPLDIGAAIEIERSEGEEGGASRIVIFGDTDFATNGYFNWSGNSDLFLSSVNWLGKEEDLISIRPREAKFSPLVLTRTQGRIFFLLPVVILPAVVIAAGIGVWRRRKNL